VLPFSVRGAHGKTALVEGRDVQPLLLLLEMYGPLSRNSPRWIQPLGPIGDPDATERWSATPSDAPTLAQVARGVPHLVVPKSGGLAVEGATYSTDSQPI
jgi:hypothetical protein